MKVDIHRYDPDADRKWVDTFDVPTDGRSMTVMDVLDEISFTLDNTLAYYKHSVCNHGICGRCSIQINGQVRLACTEIANDFERLTLAPMPSRKVVRDLVTRRQRDM